MESATQGPGSGRALGRGWLGVLLAGVLVGVAAAGGVGWRAATGESGVDSGPTAPSVAPRDVLTGLPAQVRVPATPADLPADRAVGPAAFLYHVERSGGSDEPTGTLAQRDIHLVTRSGEQFRAGRTPATLGPRHQSLSPDGRWLAVRRDGQWWLRDLTGSTERTVPPGYEVWGWSTDSGSVLIAQLSQSGRAFAVLSTEDGSLRRLDVPATQLTDVVTLVDGRHLVLVDLEPFTERDAASPKLTVRVWDMQTGATRDVPVLRPGQLRPGETFNSFVPLLTGGGVPARVWVQIARQDAYPTGGPEGPVAIPASALVGVDVRSGAPVGRVELAEPRKGAGEGYLGIVGGELVLDRTARGRSELVAVDPVSGDRRVVTELPHLARVLVPGELW
ncbi:hypothetical protein [Micromonospora psammae]|uniref:hypothetical protein n=1 Tax=Micromonospora sp. CPCC 205556 TaxID=3122398 RepID=UPI002FEF0AC4